MSPQIAWSHPSVRKLLAESAADDPFEEITRRAREQVLEAMEAGWEGPPYDPFALAERLGVPTVPREGLDDARLVPTSGEGPRIEFNPMRRPARVRFSIAHELAHLLFSDYGDQPRYRTESREEHARPDGWQLEVLCNVAAAELLMPAGAFPIAQADDLDLAHLLDLRATFGVSTEALLRRVLRLTERPASMFACARLADGHFRVDYTVSSRAWRPVLRAGALLAAESALSHCTAVGFSVDEHEQWPGEREELHVQAVGIPPYPGDSFPRVIGLIEPPAGERVAGVRMVRGDATLPQRDGPTIVAHIVNDRARSWGGYGFARALGRRLPGARHSYSQWATDRQHRKLGAVHLDEVESGLWVASMVAQAGFGERAGVSSRLKLPALATCLAELAWQARERHASVHMPAIGTGQGATPWPTIRDLLLEGLVDAGVPVIVYVPPDQPMPEENPATLQLSLA